MDDQQALGQLEPVGEEVTFIQPISGDSFERIDFTFFAGARSSPAGIGKPRSGRVQHRRSFRRVRGRSRVLVCAPWMQEAMVKAAVANAPSLLRRPWFRAHPAALVLALLLERLQRIGAIRQASATVLEPASEYGRAALDELHQQT